MQTAPCCVHVSGAWAGEPGRLQADRPGEDQEREHKASSEAENTKEKSIS